MYVPHDMKSLIARCGGQERFTQRLDTFFTHNNGDQRWLIGMYQIANEPGFLAPSLYNYVNRQDKTARLVRYILAERYKTTRDGIPGNDDSGKAVAIYASVIADAILAGRADVATGEEEAQEEFVEVEEKTEA